MSAPNLKLCCVWPGKSPEEAEMASKSKQIDKMIKSDQRKIQQEVKVLLLGAGESGKSTFLKQMKIIHGVVFETDELKELRRNIYQNCIKGMRVLVDAQRKLKIKLDNPINSQFGDQVFYNILQQVLYWKSNEICQMSKIVKKIRQSMFTF